VKKPPVIRAANINRGGPPPKPRSKAETQLLADIRLAIGARPDVLIARINTGVYAAPGQPGTRVRSAPNGFPDIIGTQLQRIKTRRTVETNFSLYEGPEYWHTYGQAIAIETKTTRGRMSEQQAAWRAAFERVGGIYVLARDVRDVLDVLGPVPEWVK